jgi:hypothetical protein
MKGFREAMRSGEQTSKQIAENAETSADKKNDLDTTRA